MELGINGKAPELLEPVRLVSTGVVRTWLEGVPYRNERGQLDVELQDGRTYAVLHWLANPFPRRLEEHIRQHGGCGSFADQELAGLLGTLATRLLQALRLAPPLLPVDPTTGKPVQNVGGHYWLHCGQAVQQVKRQCTGVHRPRLPAARPLHLLHRHQLDFCFAMPENYLVLMVWPLPMHPIKMAIHQAPGKAFLWQPGKGKLLYAIDKRWGSEGHVTTYKSEAFFCFYTINAWEEGGKLHIDLCGYDESAWFEVFKLPHMRSPQVTPHVDIRRAGGCVVGTTQQWQVPAHFPGEPIFVARPGAQREDDGVLLVVVLDGKAEHSYLLILDARSMQEVARADCLQVIEFDFHGNLIATGSSTELT